LVRELVLRDPIDAEMAKMRYLQMFAEIQAVERGELADYKNFSKDCNWCWLRDACELHEIGSNFEDLLEATTKKHDPMAKELIYNRS
jgi:hypothetical protein